MADDDTPTDHAPSPDVDGTDCKGADLAAETLASVRRSHEVTAQRRPAGSAPFNRCNQKLQFTGSGPDRS